MLIDTDYWYKVLKQILIFILTIIGIFITFKFAIFYMPFLIAFVISQIIEPIIRFLMKKFKLKRKTSSIIVFVIVLGIIISLLAGGIVSLISESYNLLNGFNGYVSMFSEKIQYVIDKINFDKLNISDDIKNTIKNSVFNLLGTAAEWGKEVLNNLISFITSIPTMVIYTVITILALFFICTDKIYMIDLLEHHFPKAWVKKITKFMKKVFSSLGSFINAQAILVLVSFFICLIGLTIFNIAGLNVSFPLLSAIGIAFVDALPIFGSATAIIPWAVISALNGDIKLAIALLVLLAIMAFTRQTMEPKIVSGQLGIHPIFTLIAMYTGFKVIGVLGLLLGPIILIILKHIFEKNIDKGIIKSIFLKE